MVYLSLDEEAIAQSIMGRKRAAESVYRSEMAACERAFQRLRTLLMEAHGISGESVELSVLEDGRIALVTPPEEPEGDSELNPEE